ncbi:hypothetical protein HKX48_006849 [Thoreauomyces humboldtii]|nr:hypothetical protein HKX48_006849 [Thoreauomyces humboldtii]
MQALVLKPAPVQDRKANGPKQPPRYDALDLSTVKVNASESASDSTTTLVNLHAAALNHRDVFIRQGLYPRIVPESVLGSDGAGVRADTGERVLINPSFNWASDPLGPEDPEKYGMLGLLPFPGTFATQIRVPHRLVHPIPSHLSFTEAAALPLAGLTAWRATFTRGEVSDGKCVLVSGIGGGVALFALQFAVAAGAKVFVTSSSPEKIQRAVALGATGGVNYKDADWVKKLQALLPKPLDTVIDGAGGDSIAGYVKLLRTGGRLVTYGSTTGPTATLVLPSIFLKQITILGSTMGNEVEFKAMTEFVAEHRIRPVVSKVFEGLANYEQAFQEMRNGSQFGKLVIRILPETDKAKF